MSRIELRNVSKSFGTNQILNDLSFVIESRSLTVVLGPSGCGKSTILRLIAGLDFPDHGRIMFDGEDITETEPRNRNVAMVFQSYALYPHLTVRENLSFPLRVAKLDKATIASKVQTVAELLGLLPLLDRSPKTLSGGERQRTAVGRAIVRDPRLFLFDEPLSNLDFQLRSQMRGEIRALQQRLGITMLYVTHDQTEAMTMADELIVLSRGKIMQIGKPTEVYDRPANVFTAGFIGSPPMNLLRGRVDNGKVTIAGGCLANTGVPAGEYTVGVRPEDLNLGEEGCNIVSDRIEYHGSATFLHGAVGGQRVIVVVPKEAVDIAAVKKRLTADRIHLFDPASGERRN